MSKLITVLFVVLAVVLAMIQPEQATANTYAHNVRITQPNTEDPFDGRFDDGSGAAIRFVLADRADSVVINIKLGTTLVRTLRGTTFVSGDSLLIWDGRNNNGQFVGTGNYSVEVTAYDQGYGTYTQIQYDGPGNILSTRGVTKITNPALKNFGFSYAIDNGGYLNTTGISRFSANARPWGDVRGNPKVNNTGIVLGPGEVRYSPAADADGYVYVISYTQRQLVRFHTDTLNAALVDSGYFGTPWYINGLGIKQRLDGSKWIAMTAKNASGTATLGTDSRILSFNLSPGASTYFGPKDTLVSSRGQAIFWDVVFGRDSIIYATFNPPTGSLRPGIAKFNLAGRTLPLTMADTSWTVRVDSGRGNTATYYFGGASDGSQDVLYFVIARVASGNPPSGQGIYAVTNLNASQPTRTFAYPDLQNNASITRSDVSVDAVGNILYFENSNEEIALISPPTGPNSYTLNALPKIRVIQSQSIAAVRIDANNDFIPDRLGDTATVVGIVNGVNLTASANRFSYSIQDATGGIVITKASQTGGGTVYQVGDRVAATGRLGQFNGTAQIDIFGDLADNVILLDQGNAVVPVTLTIDQRLANGEAYESMLININYMGKLSGTWPASGANSTLTMWDGFSSLAMFIDLDTDIDGTAEAVYPVNVIGVATQFTSATPPNTGYQISPRFRADFTEGVQAPPNPHFPLLTPAHNSTVVLDSTAQTVVFKWRKAVDLNNDPLIYQWVPVGFTAISTGNAAADTFLVRTGQQLLTYMGTADTVVLRWSVRTKDTPNPIVNNVDTFSVRLVRGTIVGVAEPDLLPKVFALAQNYPNPFNPSTVIRYSLPTQSSVSLKIYNILGQQIITLVDEVKDAGYFNVEWHGRNEFGSQVASGVYFYRLEAKGVDGTERFTSLKKLMLLK